MTHGADDKAKPRFDADFANLLSELFRWRRDVRRFRSDPVGSDVVEELVALATLAPSVGHSQPWRFVAVESGRAPPRHRRQFRHMQRGGARRL